MLLNGVLSASEISIVALRGSRLDQLVASGSRRALAVKRLRDDPERFLATVQIGITVIGALAGAFGGATFAKDIEPFFRQVPLLASRADAISLGLVVAIVSYLSVVVGELVPKSLALRHAERYALLVGKPLLGLSWLARPAVWFLTVSSNVVLRLFGDRTSFTEARFSSEELQQLVVEAAKTGSVHPSAGNMAARALELPEVTAAHVMVPRGRVVALPREASFDAVFRLVAERGFTRMPVYEGTLDKVIGYVSIKDVVARSVREQHPSLDDVLRPAFFVGESMRAVALLDEMKRRRAQLAIVVDEQGVTSGIVTIEDLIEEVVGEIASEHEAPAPEIVRREPDGSFVVQGSAAVRDVNRALGLSLPVGDTYATIAGLCLELAECIPPVGERLPLPGGIVLEILEATERHVRVVRIHPPPEPGPAEPSS